jgi:hypothetical protein
MARTPSRLPFVLPAEVEALESELVVVFDRRARLRSRVEALRGEYSAAISARSAAAAAVLEAEALEGVAGPDLIEAQRAAVAEVERVVSLIEAAGGGLARADVEVRTAADRLRPAFEAAVDKRLADAEALFDERARALGAIYREVTSLRLALGRDVPRDFRVLALADGEPLVSRIMLDTAIEDTVARAASLLEASRERSAIPSLPRDAA